jgi:hypothetical protein
MLRLAFALLLLVLGCARFPTHSVVHADKSFSGKAVRHGPTAFLLPPNIDIADILPEVVAGFGGDPRLGVAQLRESIVEHLRGTRASDLDGLAVYLNFRDLREVADTSLACQSITFAADEFGLTSMNVLNPGALGEQLRSSRLQYLVIFVGMKAHRATGSDPNGLANTVVVSGDCFVWGVKQEDVLWHGMISGARAIGADFGKHDADNVSATFVGNLYQAFQ